MIELPNLSIMLVLVQRHQFDPEPLRTCSGLEFLHLSQTWGPFRCDGLADLIRRRRAAMPTRVWHSSLCRRRPAE